MKLASKKLCLVIASATLVFAGCTKVPPRSTPADTLPPLGPQNGGSGIVMPTDITTPSASGLEMRNNDFDPNGQNRAQFKDSAIYFDLDRSDVKASERPKAQAVKEYLEKNPTYKLLLEGHCDWRGTAEYNLGLGTRRADAVKKYLQSIGVPADKLDSTSKGSLEAVKEGGDAVWAKDRRVDFIIVNPKPATGAL